MRRKKTDPRLPFDAPAAPPAAAAPPKPPRPRHEFRSEFPLWPHQWRRDNPQFVGLSEALIDVICDDTITGQMIEAFWRVLDDGEPHHVHEVIRKLSREPWWKPEWTRSTKERFVRKIFDTGIARGYRFCSGNYGYALGDTEMIRAFENREEALARGAYDKAAAARRVREAMENRSA